MKYIDTQIISYVFKGNTDLYNEKIEGEMISSIVACEFLNVFLKNDLKNANYYPFYNDIFVMNGDFMVSGFDSKKHCKYGKRRTDSLLIDLNNNYESFKIYGNRSISKLLNCKSKKGIMLATGHLSKQERKDISDKIDFLIDNNLKVVPLDDKIVINMLQIMSSIEGEYNFKNNFRNSVMDLLIASTALTNGINLCTKDKELNRIICKDYDLKYKVTNGILTMSNENKKVETTHFIRMESKNYINRGWQYKINSRV